ncbi:MAG: hypothetical protein ACAH59_10795 [Pseudobdellovibrionaceae bacterium]
MTRAHSFSSLKGERPSLKARKRRVTLLKEPAFLYTGKVKLKWTAFPLILVIALLPQSLWAVGEQMGTFEFSEFSLSPRARVQEPSTGGFELRESWIGFEWKRDESLSGEISFGTADLVEPAIWYPALTGQVQMVQATVKAKTPYFDVRAGLLPIPIGYEGAFPEWEWSLPETRVRHQRWFTRRDYGVELKAETKPWMTSLTVYNGESGSNLDQKMWVAGLWRYLNPQGYGLLMTAQVGRTDEKSTTGSLASTTDFGFQFDPNDSAKFRHGSLAVYRKWKRHLVLLEGGRGEILQGDEKNPYAWGHLDICANLGGDLNLLMRYEHSQANTKEESTVMKSTGLGISVSSADRLSMVTLWANKNTESPERQNDEALLIFRLNSNFL